MDGIGPGAGLGAAEPAPGGGGFLVDVPVPLGELEPEAWPDWQTCDGRALRAADYPELADRLKQNYGTGDKPGTFRLPDMRPYLRRIRVRP